MTKHWQEKLLTSGNTTSPVTHIILHIIFHHIILHHRASGNIINCGQENEMRKTAVWDHTYPWFQLVFKLEIFKFHISRNHDSSKSHNNLSK